MKYMKKVNKIFTTISVSIVIIFSICMFGTFLSDYLVSINWFGDYTSTLREGVTVDYWGARHYWYVFGVSLLFLTSVVRVIVKVVHIIDNE